MSSLVSLSFLFLLLLAANPGNGADISIYPGSRLADGQIKRTGAYEEEILNQHISLDLASRGTHRAPVLQLRGDKQASVTNDSRTDSEGEKATTDGADSTSTEQSDSGSGDQASAGNSTVASPLDSMYIEIRKPGLGSPLTETVFKQNGLTGLFNTCVIDPADPSKEENSTACYVDDAYNDRLAFRMTFRSSAAALETQFENNPPLLELIGDSSDIAEPSILTRNIDKQSSTGDISIAYGCKSTSNGTIALQMTLHFGEGEENSTTIRWKKICMNQQNDQIEFGYLLNEKGSSSLRRQPFPNEESALVVAPNDISTEIYIKLGKEGAQQAFLAPYITSSNPDITPVAVRGNHPSGGVLEGLEQTTLQVNYDCQTKGVSDISLSVGIPPFDNLTALWKKDCGGRKATNLQVGTSEDSHDVVENGNPTSPYMVAIENIGTPHSDEHLHLPGNQSDWTVYIRNSDADSERPEASEAALHVGRITLTIERPDVVAGLLPKVSSRGMTGWREQHTADHIVGPGEALKVSFHFLCRAIGESRVLITVPILQYDTLEFGIAKECAHIGTAHKARELVWTVGNVFGVAVLAFIMLILTWWWRRRRAATKGFEALPVTER